MVAELNGQEVKLVKLRGEFVWHQHEGEDELFLVLKGRLRMELRDVQVPNHLTERRGGGISSRRPSKDPSPPPLAVYQLNETCPRARRSRRSPPQASLCTLSKMLATCAPTATWSLMW